MGDDPGNGRTAAARPEHVTVTALDGGAQVTWERPGGRRVTSYDLTPCLHTDPLPSQTVTVDGAATSGLVRGLTNGETYTIRVTPWHDEAPGPSALSPSFQPNPPPGSPTDVLATGGEQSATVSWVEPATGGPVAEYRVVAMPGEAQVTVPATQVTALVTGLRNRARHTFTVTAMNGAGASVSGPSNPVWPGDDVPRYLFALELFYLLALGLLAYLYTLDYQAFTVQVPGLGGVTVPGIREMIPESVVGVPVSIPWFGAAGAVLVGLYGIFDHGHLDWQRRLNPWHIGRPFTGALLGTVGFVAFIGVIRATGATPVTNDPAGRFVYYVIAFLVGFREIAFRTLIARVSDLLLGPGSVSDKDRPPSAPAQQNQYPPAPARTTSPRS
jgi:Fibronectin type III domain